MMLDEDAPITRAQLCAELEKRQIQTRPISGANWLQPAFDKFPTRKSEDLYRLQQPLQGFFVGQSHCFTEAHGELLCSALKSIF